jgi:hypothetical protein
MELVLRYLREEEEWNILSFSASILLKCYVENFHTSVTSIRNTVANRIRDVTSLEGSLSVCVAK